MTLTLGRMSVTAPRPRRRLEESRTVGMGRRVERTLLSMSSSSARLGHCLLKRSIELRRVKMGHMNKDQLDFEVFSLIKKPGRVYYPRGTMIEY